MERRQRQSRNAQMDLEKTAEKQRKRAIEDSRKFKIKPYSVQVDYTFYVIWFYNVIF